MEAVPRRTEKREERGQELAAGACAARRLDAWLPNAEAPAAEVCAPGTDRDGSVRESCEEEASSRLAPLRAETVREDPGACAAAAAAAAAWKPLPLAKPRTLDWLVKDELRELAADKLPATGEDGAALALAPAAADTSRTRLPKATRGATKPLAREAWADRAREFPDPVKLATSTAVFRSPLFVPSYT